MNFNLEIFHKFDFTDSPITDHKVYSHQSERLSSQINLQGSFAKKQYENCKFWCLCFKQFENLNQKCTLIKSNKVIYEYLCAYHHGARFKDFILHSNGRRYFPFHVDLYGISYLDIDSLEVFHYVPEGYAHDFSYLCGESFIVTDIHYDRNTDLIAYGGCYWAGPSDVMVGDFSEPLNFAPKLFDIGKIADPDSEGYDIDFKRWQDDRLVINVEGEEKSVSIEEIIKGLK